MAARNIVNSYYKVKAESIINEALLNIEEGAMHVTDEKLKVHLNGVIKTVTATSGSIVFVDTKSDFPNAESGVITLNANITYFITSNIDLLGDRLVGSSNTTIIGGSSENCSITSTGLGVGIALFTSEWTTPIRHIAFKDVDTCLDINGVTNAPVALDWTGVNFVNIPNIGTVSTCSNFIFSKGAFINSEGLIFTGSIGTVGIDNSLFVGSGNAGNIIELDASCVITRRFRIIYSSIVSFGSTVGININAAVTIPNESYILDTVNFSGGGTYISGVLQSSNKSLFVKCLGIDNTSVNGQIYMQGNTTATNVSVINTFYKVAGTTTASTENRKYTATDNRLTCDAVIPRKYLIQCSMSFDSGNNNVVEFGFYDSKLGGIRTPSRIKTTANPAGRAENISFSCIVNHSSPDYLEVHTANTSGTSDVTVTDMNFIITEIN